MKERERERKKKEDVMCRSFLGKHKNKNNTLARKKLIIKVKLNNFDIYHQNKIYMILYRFNFLCVANQNQL